MVIDTSDGAITPYLIDKGEVYFFDGADHLSAVGIRDFFKVAVPVERWGEVAVVADASAIVENRAGDSYYQVPPYARLSVGWQKRAARDTVVGAQGAAQTAGRAMVAFEDPGTATPDLAAATKPTLGGDLWVRQSF